MKWISSAKSPPLYIRKGDEWYCETNKTCYECDIEKRIWWATGRDPIPFPKKTQVISDKPLKP